MARRILARGLSRCSSTLFLVMLWILNFHKQQLITAQQINARSVTVGDYTVAVSGLGVHNSSRKTSHRTWRTTARWRAVVYVKNIGTLLMTEHKLADAKAKLREIRAFRQATASGGKPGMFAGAFRRPSAAATRRQALGRAGGAGRRELEAKVSELAKQKVTNVGEAFVTFNYEMHANNCFYDHRRGVIERILGWFGCVRAAPKFKGKQMTLDAPPEPCEPPPENYDVRGLARTSPKCQDALRDARGARRRHRASGFVRAASRGRSRRAVRRGGEGCGVRRRVHARAEG